MLCFLCYVSSWEELLEKGIVAGVPFQMVDSLLELFYAHFKSSVSTGDGLEP